VATQSREIKKVILKYLQKTGDPSQIGFKLHDFGFRGVSSVESAGIGGAAHLVNFLGTDTVRGIELLADYYDEECAGFSIPASEHSTITSWGKENEGKAYDNMLEAYKDGYMACVSDSFDIRVACTELWGGILRDKVLARDGCLVVRPDSGDPVKIVLDVVRRLGEAFGYSVNNRGYKVLDPHVRVIQGDGVNLDIITEILRTLDQYDWSADNIAFGMGGALLQKLDRDTQKMAFKCSYVEGEVDEVVTVQGDGWVEKSKWSRDVYKEPVTDKGKNSKRGRLALVKRDGRFHTVREELANGENQLVEVFRDGRMLVNYTLKDIRERAKL